jgi:hypothetical protein
MATTILYILSILIGIFVIVYGIIRIAAAGRLVKARATITSATCPDTYGYISRANIVCSVNVSFKDSSGVDRIATIDNYHRPVGRTLQIAYDPKHPEKAFRNEIGYALLSWVLIIMGLYILWASYCGLRPA